MNLFATRLLRFSLAFALFWLVLHKTARRFAVNTQDVTTTDESPPLGEQGSTALADPRKEGYHEVNPGSPRGSKVEQVMEQAFDSLMLGKKSLPMILYEAATELVGHAGVWLFSSAIFLYLVTIPVKFAVLCVKFYRFRSVLFLKFPKWPFSVNAIILYGCVLFAKPGIFVTIVACIVLFASVGLLFFFPWITAGLETAGFFAAVRKDWVQNHLIPYFGALEAVGFLLLRQTDEEKQDWISYVLVYNSLARSAEVLVCLYLFLTGCEVGVSYLEGRLEARPTSAPGQSNTSARGVKTNPVSSKEAKIMDDEARRRAALAAARRFAAQRQTEQPLE